MGLATQYWSILGVDYPPAPIANEWTHEENHTPWSLAFFCPVKGEIWARRFVLSSEGTPQDWLVQVVKHPSVKHIDHWNLPPAGSILRAWDNERHFINLPPEVLQREFLLHYDWAKRNSLIQGL